MKNIEIVSEIVSKVFSERAVKISELIEKGCVNEVFIVETDNSKLVVRMNDANSIDEYKKEVWSASRAKEKYIPVAEILSVGIFGEKAYSIQTFIEGSEGRDLSVDKKLVWKKLGEYARRIHTIKVGGFGLNFRDMTEGNFRCAWLRYLNYNIESLNETDELLKLKVLTKKQSEKAKKIFENFKTREFNFGLNHGDLSLKNTIVDEFGTVHLIDWGSSEANIVPHHDLIQLLKINMLENDPDDAEFQSFLDGYGITGDEYKEMLPDLKALSLLRAVDKLRWALDWKIPELKNYVSRAKKTVEKYLKQQT